MKRREVERGGLLAVVVKELRLRFREGGIGTLIDMGGGQGTTIQVLRDSLPIQRAICIDLKEPRTRGVGIEYTIGLMESSLLGRLGCVGDVILLIESLSHVFDTDAVLLNAWTLLRPGGVLIVTTPNLAAMVNRLALLAGIMPIGVEVSARRVYGREGQRITGIIRPFTPSALRQILAHNRFEVELVTGVREDFRGEQYGEFRDGGRRFYKLARVVEKVSVRLNKLWAYRVLAVARRPLDARPQDAHAAPLR